MHSPQPELSMALGPVKWGLSVTRGRRLASRLGAVIYIGVALLSLTGLGACSTSTATSLNEPVTPLLFVSNRNRNDSQRPAAYFGDGIGSVSYGECAVDAIEEAEQGRIDGFLDFVLPFRGANIESVTEFDADGFDSRLSSHLASDDGASIVVFVHGYAYSFARGCRRLSAVQDRLGDRVKVVLFSWPSNGNPLAYGSDRRDLERSVPQLTALLSDLRGRFGGGRVNLVAHSMGAHGVMEALRDLDAQSGPGTLMNNLVLLAPDYHSDEFESALELLRSRVGRATAYVSDNDVLLKLSSVVNRGDRLGEGIEDTVLASGVETIDVSDLRRYHPTGHEYYHYHPIVMGDLLELLAWDRAAADRRSTRAISDGGFTYWRLVRETE